jgi:hypothetical protein
MSNEQLRLSRHTERNHPIRHGEKQHRLRLETADLPLGSELSGQVIFQAQE